MSAEREGCLTNLTTEDHNPGPTLQVAFRKLLFPGSLLHNAVGAFVAVRLIDSAPSPWWPLQCRARWTRGAGQDCLPLPKLRLPRLNGAHDR